MNKTSCQEYENSRELFFEALRKKIRQAEECFYKLSFNKIVPSIRKHGATLDEAKDAFQEGMMVFYMRLDGLHADNSPIAFLFSIVYNKWIDKTRKDKGRESFSEELPIATSEPNPMEQLLDREMQQELRDAIAQLEPSSQRLLQLLVFEEKKPEEVAQSLNMSRASVDNQKYRIVKYLREIMKGGKKP